MSTVLLESQARHFASSQTIGDRAACHALLNCLIKEFALPQSLLRYAAPDELLGLPFDLRLVSQGPPAVPLLVGMPDGTHFAVLVDRQDSLGSQYYLSGVFGKRADEYWRLLDLHSFAMYVLDSCAAITGSHNDELLSQVLASRDLKQAIADHSGTRAAQPLANYLSSEQGLWFGHPTHPAPKARLWPKRLHHAQFSPEFRVPTPLHLLEVPLEGLWIGSNGLSPGQVLAGLADQAAARTGRAILSLHPVQAELFLQDSRVQRLLAARQIRDIGRKGLLAYPTASVRTLYVPGHDYFIKGSLNLRITNCVRKNAWYELESAVIVDGVLENLTTHHSESAGGLRYAAEPGAVSWCPSDHPDEDRLWFREQTGVILRRNFCQIEGESASLLAGTLFGRDLSLVPNIQSFLAQHLGKGPAAEDLLRWFGLYQALLLRPVLSVFFNHGVVFEPHLQNVVVVHNRGQPVSLLLRDHEGVKLTAERGMQWVPPQTDERIRRSLEYRRSQGWNRIAYCLFVNNLSEAVLALTYEQPRLASAMWQLVRQELQEIRRELQGPAPELDDVIRGGLILCKTNLRVRLAAAADKHAGYVHLRSPWAQQPL